MNAKNVAKFKKPEEYVQSASNVNPAEIPASLVEVFFRLKLMPAGLVQYAVERVTIHNNVVVERKVITERDILQITLSKIEDALIAQVRR